MSDGGLVSYCVRGERGDTLLPVADKVVFMRAGQDGPVAPGDWGRGRELAGGLIEARDHYPARCRVRGFPGTAALAAVGVGELQSGCARSATARALLFFGSLSSPGAVG